MKKISIDPSTGEFIMTLRLLFLVLSVVLTDARASDKPRQWTPAHSASSTTEEPSSSERKNNQNSKKNKSLPLPSDALSYAQEQALPLSGPEIEALSRGADEVRRGRAYQPRTIVPRISTLTVNLSPGANIPILRTAANQTSSLTFSDSTGAPWKLGAPPLNSNHKGFQVSYIPSSALIAVQALRRYDTGNITVYLEGLHVPVVIHLTSGSPQSRAQTQIMDSRLDLRIPQRGPNAKPSAPPDSQIALYNNLLQAFLDGVPPLDAKPLRTRGQVPSTTVWQWGEHLYIRTQSDIRDEFEQTLSSLDGTHLWKLPLTPTVHFSVMGKTEPLIIELE
ncbi:DotH/IcmK family type IV secretion protein [Candidatus Hamiltonella defensa]|uniref:DotH/IcmK family type IV secretion protein n=2 Tax=Candidatus Williamhamiltonella defendens TaxID=138072 RepID=UPI000C1DE972|nr:DotH/IcmK family type IV secretion protein [Candidatus Hamiltonella defensa]